MIKYILDQSCASKLMEEPNFQLFKYRGMFCLITRSWTMHLNGYVAVPEGHPLYGKSYTDSVVVEDMESIKFNGNYLGLFCMNTALASANILSLDMLIDVHCGLTFSRSGAPGIYDNELGRLWWFGFDTGHADDLPPIRISFGRDYFPPGAEYRDYNYVHKEVIKLADQLAAFQPKPLIDVAPFHKRLDELLERIMNN